MTEKALKTTINTYFKGRITLYQNRVRSLGHAPCAVMLLLVLFAMLEACSSKDNTSREKQNLLDILSIKANNNSADEAGENYLKMGEAALDSALFESSGLYYSKALEVFSKEGNNHGTALAYKGMASSLHSPSKLPESISLYQKALDLFLKTNDLNNYHTTQVDLASVFFYQKEFQKSLELHRSALKYFDTVKDTVEMVYILSGMVVALDNLDSIETAALMGKKGLELSKNNPNTVRNRSAILTNMAHLYKKRGELGKAEPFLRQGLELMEKNGDNQYIPIGLTHLGGCLLELGRVAEAEPLLTRALAAAKETNNERAQLSAELALSKLFQTKGEFEASLLHRLEYERHKDSLFSKEKSQFLAEANALYENEKKQAEIQRLTFEKERESLRNQLIALCSLGFILIIGGWFYTRYRREKLLFLKEKEILNARAQTQEAELQLAKAALENFSKKVHEKTQMLDELQARFNADPESLTKPTETLDRYLGDVYSQRILTDKDWEQFKVLFERVYPGFHSKARNLYPEITQAELRLLLLIKLNLETKEIASMLGVSTDSVKKTRQRLRRRLNLVEEEKLEDIVKSI